MYRKRQSIFGSTVAFLLATASTWAGTTNYNSTTSTNTKFKDDTVNLFTDAVVTFNGTFEKTEVNVYDNAIGLFTDEIKKEVTFNVLGLTASITVEKEVKKDSVINVSGANASVTLEGKIDKDVIINVSGGSVSVQDEVDKDAVFNVSGGSLSVDSIKNDATFNVSGGSMTLNDQVGKDAAINLSGGTLLLGKDNIFDKKNSNLTVSGSGGTIDTQGYDIELDSVTLNSGSNLFLDFGGEDSNVTLDNISGAGKIYVTGYNSLNGAQISFVNVDQSFNPSTQVFFGNNPGQIVGGVIVPAPLPVPEPGTWLAGGLLVFALGFLHWRRRKVA